MTTAVLPLIAVYTVAKGSTALSRNICRLTTRNNCNGDRFRKWAEQVGTHTHKTVDAVHQFTLPNAINRNDAKTLHVLWVG